MRTKSFALLLAGAFGLAGPAAQAEVPCPGFSWDVSAEHALFMTAPLALPAGADRHSAPSLEAGRLVQLELKPASAVHFAAPPARPAGEDTYAGLARLEVEKPGAYRISVNQSVWIDVVEQGRLVPAIDYEGSRSCDAPHKVVVFRLPGGKPLVLQLSGAVSSAARVTLTPVPGAPAVTR